MSIRFTIITFFFVLICYSQENTNNLFKHQVGIGISKFVNSAFPSDKNAYSINYRYRSNSKYSLRAAANYDKDDSNGFVDLGFKLGIDKKIKTVENWNFYYGIDLLGNYTFFDNINKDQYVFGGISFLGIQYNFSKSFSFSIEPGLYLRHNIVIDNSTFSKDNKSTWTESGLGQLGYINLNFHF